jgi:predicted cupin superfamily sugar epimerase
MTGMRARQLIETLQLQAHPEGGWYREVFRSTAQVKPNDGRPTRQALTTIYYLLEQCQHSRWHRVSSDEVWIHLEGAPLALWTSDAALRTAPAHFRLGPVDVHGTRPQHTVPAGQWQAARPIAAKDVESKTDGQADYSLVSCTVGPGFDFSDFSFMLPDGEEAALIRHHWPELAALL